MDDIPTEQIAFWDKSFKEGKTKETIDQIVALYEHIIGRATPMQDVELEGLQSLGVKKFRHHYTGSVLSTSYYDLVEVFHDPIISQMALGTVIRGPTQSTDLYTVVTAHEPDYLLFHDYMRHDETRKVKEGKLFSRKTVKEVEFHDQNIVLLGDPHMTRGTAQLQSIVLPGTVLVYPLYESDIEKIISLEASKPIRKEQYKGRTFYCTE